MTRFWTTTVRRLAFVSTVAFAASAASAQDVSDEPADPHPVVSTDARWMTPLAITVAAVFVLAAVVGPLVRVETPAVVPDATSHEEDPGADARR